MIRYSVTEADLRNAIQAAAATWLAEADRRTAAFKKKRRYFEPPNPTWSAIKGVYMKLQHNKCAYCERRLEGPEYGRVEHDVEHFRPKNAVKVWPTPTQANARAIAY